MVRLLSFDAGDEECSKVTFLVVDGAHRRWVCVKLGLKMMWARFAQPTMSYGDLVCTPLLCVFSLCWPVSVLARTVAWKPCPASRCLYRICHQCFGLI